MTTNELDVDGFTTLPDVITAEQCRSIAAQIAEALSDDCGGSIRAGQGSVVGGRNLISHWQGWRQVTQTPIVTSFLRQHIGSDAGLVRILFFDKPPGQSWSLSLHRDQTIAVQQHHSPPNPFTRPTLKAGVPHVVANDPLLRQMLTLRLHIDSMHSDNGPLVVVPGSHVQDDASSLSPEPLVIDANLGDLFVMRPLLLHGSLAANPASSDHRRILHLEFAPGGVLPHPYQWFRFEPIA